MKRVKYIVILMMLMFGTIIPGELYQFYMDDFCDFYTETFYYDDSYFTKEEMLSDISTSADNHNVGIFLMSEDVTDRFNKEVVLYCSSSAKEYLINENHIHEGNSKSLICGNTNVSFLSFEDAPDNLIENEKTKYYLIGDPSDMRQMKSELADDYGGSFPKEDGYSKFNNVKTTLIGVWCIIGAILCFVLFYTLNNSQREYVVRASMGESLGSIYLKTVCVDVLFICAASISLHFLFGIFSYVSFLNGIIRTAILIFVILDVLINLRIFGFNIGAAFKNAAGRNAFVFGNYVVKIVSCTLTVILLVMDFAVFRSCMEFFKQEQYFKEHSDCYYFNLITVDKSEDGISRDLVTEQLYRTYSSVMEYMDPVYQNANTEIFFTSETSMKWLDEWIDGLDIDDVSANINILFPSDNELSSDDVDDIAMTAQEFFAPDKKTEVKSITYQSAKVIAIEQDYINRSEWINDPVIVVLKGQDFTPLNEENILNAEVSSTIYQPRDYNCIIKADSQQLREFAQTYGFDAQITNVYSDYLFHKSIIERTFYLCSVLIVLLIILEISINILIIKMEYNFNAVEVTVKKLLGHSKLSRIKTIFITTVVSVSIGVAASAGMLIALGKFDVLALIFALIIIVIAETVVIGKYAAKYEKENMQKILKGGI